MKYPNKYPDTKYPNNVIISTARVPEGVVTYSRKQIWFK